MKTCLKIFVIVVLSLCLVAPAALAQTATEQIPATKVDRQNAEWWPKRHEQKLQEAKQAERIDLLMIGDSITHSWENGGKSVFEEYYADRNALNLGFSGDRTEHVLWRLENGAVDGLSPKLAIVMIGTNNTGHRKDPPDQTAAGVKMILHALRTRMPEMQILLLAVFPRDEQADGELRKINDEINAIIRDYADGKHIHFLDINHVFLDENGTLPKRIMPDALHPNAEGYKLWAEAMEPMVKKLMGEE